MGIQRLPIDSPPKRPVIRNFDDSFDVRLSYLWKKPRVVYDLRRRDAHVTSLYRRWSLKPHGTYHKYSAVRQAKDPLIGSAISIIAIMQFGSRYSHSKIMFEGVGMSVTRHCMVIGEFVFSWR